MKIESRPDGVILLVCRHGTGHPSRLLTEAADRTFRDADGAHDCCPEEPCCQTPSFRKRERQYLGEAKAMGRDE